MCLGPHEVARALPGFFHGAVAQCMPHTHLKASLCNAISSGCEGVLRDQEIVGSLVFKPFWCRTSLMDDLAEGFVGFRSSLETN